MIGIDAGVDDRDDAGPGRAGVLACGEANRTRCRLGDVSPPCLRAEIIDDCSIAERGLDRRRRLVQIDPRGQLRRDDRRIRLEMLNLAIALDVADELLEGRNIGVADPVKSSAEGRWAFDEEHVMRVRIDRSNDREAMAPCDLGNAVRGRAENELVSLLDRRLPDTADRLDEPLPRVRVWLLSGNAATRQR